MVLRELVSNRCPTANHWYIQRTIRQKALRRRPTLTSKTSHYARCWLSPLKIQEPEENEGHTRPCHSERASLMVHTCRNPEEYHGNQMRSVYRSEKQMHNEHKLITQNEKDWWQVFLETPKFQGKLMQCFHATMNPVKTPFPKETEVMNRETVSRVVFILFSDLLTRQMLGNLFLMGTKIICSIRQGLKLWVGTSSGIS